MQKVHGLLVSVSVLVLAACGAEVLPTEEATPRPAPTVQATQTLQPTESAQTYDGVWAGLTEQGEVIQFIVSGGSITKLGVGFQVPGCEGLSPVQTGGNGSVAELKGNAFDFGSSNEFFAVSGEFTSSTTVEGGLQIFCEEGLTTTWSATLGGQPISAASESEVALLPTLELPDSLFSAEVGITKIDEYTAVEAAAGDWLLIRNFSESLLPIPIGWTAASSPNGGTYTYGIGPDSVNYLLTMGVFCGMETFEEQVQVSEAEIATLPQGSLLKTTLIGDVAYIRYRFYHPTQGDFFDLLLFLSYQAEGCPYLAIGGARDGMWGDFYPAMREIVSHWFTLEGEQIGVELPESMD